MNWFTRLFQHQHRWRVTGMRAGRTQAVSDHTMFRVAREIKGCDVLMRCDCGALQSVFVGGDWTMDELTGQAKETDAAVAALMKSIEKEANR